MEGKVRQIEKDYIRSDIPEFWPGDTVRVHYRFPEGEKEKVHIFEGVVIRKKGGGTRATFTVRKVSYGVGVERTFPLYSPNLQKIEVIRKGKVRRARLYYLRERSGKSARIKEKK